MIDYRKLQQWALDRADSDRSAAVDLIIDAVESAAVNGDTVAIHTRKLAMRRGFRDDLNDYCRTQSGRLTLAVVNATIPAGKSVHRREATGRVQQLHLLFLDMLFAEIRGKIGEMVGQENCLYDNVLAAIRFLELETVCPGARTPPGGAEAARRERSDMAERDANHPTGDRQMSKPMADAGLPLRSLSARSPAPS